MGQETKCEASFDGKVSTGKALLETDDLIFRGDFRLVIPLKSIQALEAVDGSLRVKWPEGTAELAIGAYAEKWVHKIRNPRSLLDKLDVKPGMRVSVCGAGDAAFREQLLARTSEVTEGKAGKNSDLIFFGAEKAADLARIQSLEKSLKRDGAIWVVYPKGRKDITEGGVFAAGKAAGLVDIKVARFSETHTALKFVIPVARRQVTAHTSAPNPRAKDRTPKRSARAR